MMTLVFSDRYRWPFGWIVQLWTGSKWVHVDVVAANAQLYGAAPDGGTRYRHASVNLHRHAENVTVDMTSLQYAKFWEFLAQQHGKPYDWMGLLGVAWRTKLQDPDKWFCSELIQAALDYAGVDTGAGPSPKFTSPAGLLRRLQGQKP